MDTTEKNELHVMVDEAILREIAGGVGRRIAQDYSSCVRGISSFLTEEGVQLHIHVQGPYRDIRMQFVNDAPVATRTLFDDVDDDEL